MSAAYTCSKCGKDITPDGKRNIFEYYTGKYLKREYSVSYIDHQTYDVCADCRRKIHKAVEKIMDTKGWDG